MPQQPRRRAHTTVALRGVLAAHTGKVSAQSHRGHRVLSGYSVRTHGGSLVPTVSTHRVPTEYSLTILARSTEYDSQRSPRAPNFWTTSRSSGSCRETNKQASANRSNGRCMLHAAMRPAARCIVASRHLQVLRRIKFRVSAKVAQEVLDCRAHELQHTTQRATHRVAPNPFDDPTRCDRWRQPRLPRSAAAVATQRRRGCHAAPPRSVRRCLNRPPLRNGLAERV
jgi:hypothetical protein